MWWCLTCRLQTHHSGCWSRCSCSYFLQEEGDQSENRKQEKKPFQNKMSRIFCWRSGNISTSFNQQNQNIQPGGSESGEIKAPRSWWVLLALTLSVCLKMSESIPVNRWRNVCSMFRLWPLTSGRVAAQSAADVTAGRSSVGWNGAIVFRRWGTSP